jgi:hypothetical protein
MDKWSIALAENLPQKLIKGFGLDYYLSSLREVRRITLEFLKKEKDEWLYREQSRDKNTVVNHYFRIFHLVEDEISHGGQIKWIKKRISSLPGRV